MLEKVKRINSIISQIAFGLSAGVLTLLTVVSVFNRYILSKPIMWSEEMQMILIVWTTFFGGALAFMERGHIAVDLLVEKFSQKVQVVLDVIIWIIVAYSITWIGQLQINRMFTMRRSGLATSILRFPSWIQYAVVAFACLLMLISHILNGVEDFKEYRKVLKGVA